MAQATSRSKSWLASTAIQQYLDLQEWQVEEIHKGLEEADRGDFASEDEVKQVLSRWPP